MTDFAPIDPEGKTDRELIIAALKGIDAAHACLDGFRREQAEVNASAAKTRRTMQRAITDVRGTVKTVSRRLGSLETTQKVDSGRIDRLAKLFGAAQLEKGEKPPKGRGIAAWPGWKLFAAVGGAISLFVFAYQLGAALAPDLARDFHRFMMGLKP